ncbi:MAG: hypothetical protein M9924_04310 [Rhizobiaceae bacterium]|nr:hypothetical protein [Rhizobiaceae bacterium]
MAQTVLWRIGAFVVVVAALIGLGVSIANYFNPDSGIAGEPGTLLVIASTTLLAIFGWLLSGDGWRGTLLRTFIVVCTVLNIIGTGFAGYLLHSWFLLAAMLLAALGWIASQFFKVRRA